MDTEKKMGIIIVVIALLVAGALGAAYFFKPTKSLIEDIIVYDNGFDQFNVQRIHDGNATFSRVEIFFKNSEQPFYLHLRYGPQELENFPSALKAEDILGKKAVYITIDPDQNLTGKAVLAALELSSGISNRYFYNIPTIGATTKPSKKNIVIACSDANESAGVIYLTLASENSISSENGCVIIRGKEEENLIMGADKVFLQLLGIIRR